MSKTTTLPMRVTDTDLPIVVEPAKTEGCWGVGGLGGSLIICHTSSDGRMG